MPDDQLMQAEKLLRRARELIEQIDPRIVMEGQKLVDQARENVARILFAEARMASIRSQEHFLQLAQAFENFAVQDKPLNPPSVACFFLDRLLPRVDRQVLRGDMEGEFKTRLAKEGPTRARRWFWRETIWTIVQQNPIVRSALVGGLTRLVEWIFRQIAARGTAAPARSTRSRARPSRR